MSAVDEQNELSELYILYIQFFGASYGQPAKARRLTICSEYSDNLAEIVELSDNSL